MENVCDRSEMHQTRRKGGRENKVIQGPQKETSRILRVPLDEDSDNLVRNTSNIGCGHDIFACPSSKGRN